MDSGSERQVNRVISEHSFATKYGAEMESGSREASMPSRRLRGVLLSVIVLVLGSLWTASAQEQVRARVGGRSTANGHSNLLDKRAEQAGSLRSQQSGGHGSRLDARAIVRAAVEAMGGEANLRNLRTISYEGIRHSNMLEQSERPSGPWLVVYSQLRELRDLVNGSVRQVSSSRGILFPDWTPERTTVVSSGVAALESNGRWFPGPAFQAQDTEESLMLAPERSLLTALDAPDLRLGQDIVLQDVPHHVVTFTSAGHQCRLFLNASTALPTAAEWIAVHPYGMFSVWGDVTTRFSFSTWMLEPGGIHYPRQWDIERNGMPYQTLTITKLSLNAAAPDGSFSIPQNIVEAFGKNRVAFDDLALGFGGRAAPGELAKEVIKLPGAWDVALVHQTDGVVILEAPVSSGYSSRVIEEARRRFPGVPIKAVVSTSDAWPHAGGVREYVAKGIPLYILDLNKPLIEKLLSAPHRLAPDALARAPKRPDIRIVSGKTTLGSGPNRIELYPIRSESGERMIMAYLTEHRLLYASDLIQRMPDGTFFMTQYLSEVADAVAREKLAVDTVFAMHLAPAPWKEITNAILQAFAAEPQER